MIKAQEDTDTNKSKASETSGLYLYALLSDQILSEIAPIFLCDRSSWIACPGEALNLRAKFSKFLFFRVFFIFIRNSDLRGGVCCIK